MHLKNIPVATIRPGAVFATAPPIRVVTRPLVECRDCRSSLAEVSNRRTRTAGSAVQVARARKHCAHKLARMIERDRDRSFDTRYPPALRLEWRHWLPALLVAPRSRALQPPLAQAPRRLPPGLK